MSSSPLQVDSLHVPVMSSAHARLAGKEAKRCADLFEASTTLTKRNDVARVEWKDVQVGPLLGEGSFASVYQAYYNNEQYALKCLKPSIVKKNKKRAIINAVTDMALEAKLLEHLVHPNIVRLHGIKAGSVIDSTLQPGGVFLLLDMLEITLETAICAWKEDLQKKRRPLALFQKRLLKEQRTAALWNRLDSAALGIARGLEYLHDHDVFHGDIKPRNVGFSANGVVQLFDLGLARPCDGGVLPERLASTPRYASPQVFSNEQAPDKASDVYSFSILLWELMALKKPFGEIRDLELFEMVVVKGKRRLPLKPIPTKRLVSLITSAWSHSPDERPSMKEMRQVLETEIATALGRNESKDSIFESDESTGPTEYYSHSESDC